MSRFHELLTRAQTSEHARSIASRVFLALFSWTWVLQITIPWWDMWRDEPSSPTRLVITLLTLIFIAAYSYLIYRLYFGQRSWTNLVTVRERWVLRGIIGSVGTFLVFWQGNPWALSLIFLVITTVITAPPLRAYGAAFQSLIFTAAVLLLAPVGSTMLVSVLAFSFVFGMLMAAQMRHGGEIAELLETRYAETRMAAAEERLRIARDLHDVLGHSLSLITLKSELASRLVDIDPEQAKQEIREVETLARSAMNDARQTVSEERCLLLPVELDDARELLEAADITLRLDGGETVLPDEISTLFAWGVREGITNVVRHSRAHECRITVTRKQGHATLTIIDDGPGSDTETSHVGSGLVGLRERVGKQGGTLVFETLPDQIGHRLTLDAPGPPGDA